MPAQYFIVNTDTLRGSPYYTANNSLLDWLIIDGGPYSAPTGQYAVRIQLQNYTYAHPYPNHPLVSFTTWDALQVPTVVLSAEYSAYIYNAFGGQGPDDIGGNESQNNLQGDPTDFIGANDWLRGFGGSDTISGVGGSDLIEGGDGNDVLYGDWDLEAQDPGNFASGDDTVNGGSNEDRIYADGGNNVYDGGQHFDLLSYYGFHATYDTGYGLQIDLNSQSAVVTGTDFYTGSSFTVASDTVLNIEHVIGTDGDDHIIAHLTTPLNQWLEGMEGNDLLVGGNGYDDLNGGAGDDTMISGTGSGAMVGGVGNDVYRLGGDSVIVESSGQGRDRVEVDYVFDFTLTSVLEDLTLLAGAGASQGTGNTDANTMIGNSFANRFTALAGDDQIYGRSGNDTVIAGDGNDTIYGDDGNDNLQASAGNDLVRGGNGHDKLLGGSGVDTLQGNNGNDSLTGGLGRDSLTGGAGADTFVYVDARDSTANAAHDRITDFASGLDKISLKGLAASHSFIGSAAFGHHLGEWRYDAAVGLLQGDLDGNGAADFEILIGIGKVLVAGDLLF